jgi:hypothetical protein
MNKVVYDRKSPYARTGIYGKFLDIANFPQVPKLADDVKFTINKTYQFRPDLLAFDLYGDSKLWYVFALRNPHLIEDPIFDMHIGKVIFIPKKENLSAIV